MGTRVAGRRHGITPYGTEAMHVLRAEKGYIIVGQETDGTPRRRRRARLGDRQEKARLRRQALALAAGHASRPAASSWSAC
jgi:glycine cleavage system aminomethyltransferase T